MCPLATALAFREHCLLLLRVWVTESPALVDHRRDPSLVRRRLLLAAVAVNEPLHKQRKKGHQDR